MSILNCSFVLDPAIFINVNMSSTFQARETLRVMMELQKRQRIETATRFQKHLDKVSLIFDFFFT